MLTDMLTVLMWCFLVPVNAQVPMNDTLEFRVTRLTWHVAEGDNVTLECLASGDPAPAINWDPNNDSLSTSENHTITIGVSQSKNYTCTATNIHGTISQTFVVIVKNTSTTTTTNNNNTTTNNNTNNNTTTTNNNNNTTTSNNTTTTTTTTATIRPTNTATPTPVVWPPASCPLELVPKRVVEKYGASFSVLCSPTTTYVEFEIINWESPFGKGKVNDNKTATWSVEKLEDWTVKPQCYVTFHDHQCTVDLNITLYNTPETVSVSVQNHDGPLLEGRSYTLRCDVSAVAPAAALTVSWLRMGEVVKTQTYEEYRTETPENVSSTLEVTAFRKNMNESITCRTTFDPKQEGPSEQFHTSKSYQVIVNYAPKITDAYNSVEVVTGRNVTFGCSAEGHPPPEVKWKYTAANNARESAWGRQNAVIILTGATSANGGIYNCVATNEVGTATRSITVTVTPAGLASAGVNIVLIVLIVILVIFVIVLLCNSYYQKKRGAYNLIDPRYANIPMNKM